MQQLLQSYLRRLTNLSGNNRSLFLPRLSSEQFIDLHEFDFAVNETSFSIIQSLIQQKKNISLCPVVDSRDASSNRLSLKLKKLKRTDQFIFEERGAMDLYVGWPFVQGKFTEDSLVRCPLIFFPVSIETDQKIWHLELRSDVNFTLNKSFLLAYAFYNQIPVDEELIETMLNEFDPDTTVFRTQLYELFKDSGVEINFNHEHFFSEKLTSFNSYKKQELEKSERTGSLKLMPEAVLGIFPQAGSYLVPDYLTMMENEPAESLEEFFYQKLEKNRKNTPRYSDQVLEENTFTPFEIDAYQEQALRQIKTGESMIIQGPPGTGKSQLIANLICDYIARGKNVLLVSQKRAALDVVYDRLKQKGLHDFSGLVHDFKNDRREIFGKIADQIERIDEYRQKNNSLDSIELERTFLHSGRKIEKITEELDEYKHALFDTTECGKSIKELYLTSDTREAGISLKPYYSQFHYSTVPDFITKISRYFDYLERYQNKNYFWFDGKSFETYTSADLPRIKETINNVLTGFGEFRQSSIELLQEELDYDATEFFLNNLDDLKLLVSNLDNDHTYKFFRKTLEETPDEEGTWIVEMERKIMRSFKGSGMETTLKSSDLGRFQLVLEHAIKTRRNPFRWLQWQLFSKDRTFISRVLVANELQSTKEAFLTLLKRIDNRLNFEHNLSEIQAKKWLGSFPEGFKKLDIQNWFFYQRIAFKSYLLYKELRSIGTYVGFKEDSRKKQIQFLQRFVDLLETLPHHQMYWNKYLTGKQVKMLLSGEIEVFKVQKELDREFENLIDFHTIKTEMLSSEQSVVDLLEDVEGSKETQLLCFQNSLALAWIDHIESKYPILRTITSLQFDQFIDDLHDAHSKKKKASQDIITLKLREKTYQELEYNRLNNRVTYRDLQHQVTKKKQMWPLRRVVSEFKEELFQLIPCWMASPESASAIFPMEEFFDLVIFDEASQCFAERGIPGIFRGKQVVIAGDSQQLRPFDLYRIRWEEDEDELSPDQEIDSLLELAGRYLKSTQLEAHYRSCTPDLIGFSNEHFYKNRLKLLPDREVLNQKIPALHYHKVEGIWEGNINETESSKVIELLQKLAMDHPDFDVGIVTFNAKQQEHIQDQIDENRSKWTTSPKNLIVRNIENIQGDERDIIIFSTAYAPDVSGRLQLKFGTLNQAGGENRLNVAVSRARKQIHLVTSLLPEHLNTENTKNPGPKLLKLYLEYVWNVSHNLNAVAIEEPSGNSADWYLKKKLSLNGVLPEGFHMDSLLSFADLTVSKGNEYAALIMTDDELFYDAVSTKQTFLYQPELFAIKNWPNIHVHSRQMWQDPEGLNDQLRLFVNRIRE